MSLLPTNIIYIFKKILVVLTLPFIIFLFLGLMLSSIILKIINYKLPFGSVFTQVLAEIIHDALQGLWSITFGPPRRRFW